MWVPMFVEYDKKTAVRTAREQAPSLGPQEATLALVGWQGVEFGYPGSLGSYLGSVALGSLWTIPSTRYTGKILELDGKWALRLGQLVWLSVSLVQFLKET